MDYKRHTYFSGPVIEVHLCQGSCVAFATRDASEIIHAAYDLDMEVYVTVKDSCNDPGSVVKAIAHVGVDYQGHHSFHRDAAVAFGIYTQLLPLCKKGDKDNGDRYKAKSQSDSAERRTTRQLMLPAGENGCAWNDYRASSMARVAGVLSSHTELYAVFNELESLERDAENQARTRTDSHFIFPPRSACARWPCGC